MLKPFIDAHVHLNTPSLEKMEMALKYGAGFLSINTNIPFFESLEKQEKVILKLKEFYPESVQYITSFELKDWQDQDFENSAIAQIKRGLANGAVGVKIWKNLGFDLRDEKGKFVMIDDPVFEPIFDFLQKEGILLVGHQGEPRNCWLPLEEMTVDSDRNYFSKHPEYHMYLQKEYPTYEEQMQARDNMLRKFPELKYVGLHLFSMEWSIEEVAKRLEQFPNTMTDLAERICHLQFQAMTEWEKVREFFIKHQDRVIYGTDVIDDGSTSGKDIADRLEWLWKFHYDFFATDKELKAPEFEGEFRGLDLPGKVVEKIFLKNAKRIYKFGDLSKRSIK